MIGTPIPRSSPPGGSTTQLQFNNAGAFGGISGWSTNGSTALTGAASTTLAIGGATIGTNALAVAGAVEIAAGASNFLRILKTYSATNYAIGDATGGISWSSGECYFVKSGGATAAIDSSNGLILKNTVQMGFTSGSADAGANDTYFTRNAAGVMQANGFLRTAAPNGGTAANWKFGIAASVSPTSPNRTIELDIGGTIYYLHAKTTNN